MATAIDGRLSTTATADGDANSTQVGIHLHWCVLSTCMSVQRAPCSTIYSFKCSPSLTTRPPKKSGLTVVLLHHCHWQACQCARNGGTPSSILSQSSTTSGGSCAVLPMMHFTYHVHRYPTESSSGIIFQLAAQSKPPRHPQTFMGPQTLDAPHLAVAPAPLAMLPPELSARYRFPSRYTSTKTGTT